MCVVINVQAMLKKMKREWNVGCGYWKTNKGGLTKNERGVVMLSDVSSIFRSILSYLHVSNPTKTINNPLK